MKIAFLFAGIVCFAVSGCTWTLNDAGNPNGKPYAGSPDSVYDSAANPPHTSGTVTYNPYSAMQPADVTPTPGGTYPAGMQGRVTR
jgi:hypothetical protein